ncbi:MAG: helix-turn-helix transcriptional regulator [Candidatus Dependentiae bacterium]|nr:helix-turn-helix transcriptional regulator [Candidatus Dependentiae bacterium]
MKKNQHIGSSFENFLESEGMLEEINVAAVKAVIARNLKEYMIKQHITQTEMAKQLKTSRSGLQRLLDPENYSVTLLTLDRAASILGKKVTMNLISVQEAKTTHKRTSKK